MPVGPIVKQLCVPDGAVNIFSGHGVGARLEAEGEDEISHDDRGPLKDDRLEASVVKILDDQHLRVDESSDLRHEPLEPGEERRVVEGPFGGTFGVPASHEDWE